MSMTKTYDYVSVGPDGKRAKGKVDATNETTAAQTLCQQAWR